MMSTTSYKNKLNQIISFFEWELKACSGTITVYSLLTGVFITVALIISIFVLFMDSSEFSTALPVTIQIFAVASSQIVYYMTGLFTIIYTIKVFTYLHNKRKADLYGALPISRTTLYISKLVSALAFSLVPAMTFLGIISMICVIFGQPIVTEFSIFYGRMLIGTIASITSYGVIAICCGTSVNSVVMFISVNIAYPLSALFIQGVTGSFFVGANIYPLSSSFIMSALCPLSAYSGNHIIYWILFSVICIASGIYLVKKRKAEAAQSSFAYYLPCHIVKVLVSFLFGMFLGTFIASIGVFGGFFGFVIGFVLASVPSFIIAHLIFYKGFSQLIRTSIPLGGLLFVVILVMGLISFDIFGYNKYIPDVDNVVSAGYIENKHCNYGNSADIGKHVKNSAKDFDDNGAINSVLKLHKELLNGVQFNISKKYQGVWINVLKGRFGVVDDWQSFSYKLKNGSVVTRCYDNSMLRHYQKDDYYNNREKGVEENFKKNLLNTKKYVQKYSGIVDLTTDNIRYFEITGQSEYKPNIYDDDYYSSSDSTIKIIRSYGSSAYEEQRKNFANKFFEAYNKDLENDSSDNKTALSMFYNQYNYNSEYSYDYQYYRDFDNYKTYYPDAVCQFTVSINSNNKHKTTGGIINTLISEIIGHINEVTLAVPASYTNTIALLRENNIINSDNTINPNTIYNIKNY